MFMGVCECVQMQWAGCSVRVEEYLLLGESVYMVVTNLTEAVY